ncbi:MAG: 1-deoxy-D-xylulose-5-phosphate synthase, partial [Nitrospirales bacterium]|nr:1-deoxy-D-xylulose-5-phosphate synthase [Nitrospirales bacterium]
DVGLRTADPCDKPEGAPAVSYSAIFGAALTDIAGEDSRVVAITAAMTEGTGLSSFAAQFPERFFDVGIAEPHAVTFAAGLASQGLRPVVAVYSTFLQRAYDEIIHDVCLQGLPVVFAVDRAGIVGEDGATHQGLFDISFLRHIPNLMVMAPKDGEELQAMLRLSLKHQGPSAIRYPRGRTEDRSQKSEHRTQNTDIETGKAEVLREGDDAVIIGVGNTVGPSLEAAELLAQEGISATVVNARFIKPLDEELILTLCRKIPRVVTVEENILAGGFGSAVMELLNSNGLAIPLKRIGIGDEFVEHGAQKILRKNYNMDAQGIARTTREFLTKG